jgi:alanine racemase
MDQLVLDVGDLPVRPGDEVTLLGPGDDGEPTAAEWAVLSGRSAYEILTGLDRRRVPAVHVAPALTTAVSPPPHRPAGR